MIDDKLIEHALSRALQELGREPQAFAITRVPDQPAQWWIDLADEDRRIILDYLTGDSADTLKDKIKRSIVEG